MFRIIPEVRENPATEKVKNSSKRPDITIPEMLVKIYPTLSEEEFANLITDKHWLGNVVKICESCIFELAKQSPFGGVYEDPNIDAKIKFTGIGPQDPKRLSERRQKTIEKILFDNNLSKGQKFECDRHGVGIRVSKAGVGSKEGDAERNLGLAMSIDEGPEWASTETARENQEEKSDVTYDHVGASWHNDLSSLDAFGNSDADDTGAGGVGTAKGTLEKSDAESPVKVDSMGIPTGMDVIQIGLSQKDQNSFFFDPMDLLAQKYQSQSRFKRKTPITLNRRGST
jgi:hypothetical protein